MRDIKNIITLLLLAFPFWSSPEVSAIGIDQKKPLEYYEQQVSRLFDENRWEEGLSVLKSGMEWYPDAASLNELFGIYHFEHKDDEKARYYLIRTLKEDPESEKARYLLISIEERNGYYSSAICYVNQLLDFFPYRQDLWRKKIGLLRLQGDDQQADRLLERLYEIYPQDSSVRKDYTSRLEEIYLKERKLGHHQKAVEALEKLTRDIRDNESYYLDLCNLQLQQGKPDDALSSVSQGLIAIPTSENLAIKKAEILAGENRDSEALEFLNEKMAFNPSRSLRQAYNSILNESARKARDRDAFRLYQQTYQRTGDPQVLNYLIDESLSRGKEEDFLKYLSEARTKNGDSFELTYKEYLFYKNRDIPRATQILYKLYSLDPNHYDVLTDLCVARLSLAQDLIEEQAYEDSEAHLYFVIANAPEDELKQTAWLKLYNVKLQLKKFDQASQILDSLRPVLPSHERYILMKAELFDQSGDPETALDMLYSAMPGIGLAEYAEEIALPYIKTLLENGNAQKACHESYRLVEALPSSRQAVQYAVSASQMTKDTTKTHQYITLGLERFPQDMFFIEKQASLLYSKKAYRDAVNLIASKIDSLPGNTALIASFSANSEMLALSLIKADKSEEALEIIDKALSYDSGNPQLLYTKGLAYEKMKSYELAEFYQRPYMEKSDDPSEFKRHLNGLGRRAMTNEINLGILFSKYLNGQTLAPIPTISYSKAVARNRFSLKGSYTAPDTEDEASTTSPSGQGIQLVAGWERILTKRWTTTATFGWSNLLFPKIIVTLGTIHSLPKDWEVEAHVGYRMLQKQNYLSKDGQYLINAGLGGAKNWEHFRSSLKLDGYILNDKPYFNVSAQLKYFPFTDGTSFLAGTIGTGTAPEANIIDYAMPGSFEKLNASFSLGGGYLIGKHMMIGIDGLFYTIYSQSSTDSEEIKTEYKNLASTYVYFTFYF